MNRTEIKREVENDIQKWINRDEIIFLSWPRQVWKTTLLKKIQKNLESEWKKTFYYNLENPNNSLFFENYDNFLNLVKNNLSNNKKIYLFLDEIQILEDPSNLLKFFYDEYKNKIKIFVSWSANLELKAKIQDSLVWRKKTFFIKPFNFKEFLEVKNFNKNKKNFQNPIEKQKKLEFLLEEFLIFWWLPEVAIENNIEIKKEILEEYVSTYIQKDIRYLLMESSVNNFNKLLIYLSKIIWNLKNNTKISKEISLNKMTLDRNLDILKHTFIFDFLSPYFENEISRIKRSEKIFIFDNWVRNTLISNFLNLENRDDKWALFENVFYYELQNFYKKKNIFFLRNQSWNEIDFITKNDFWENFLFEVKYSSFKEIEIWKWLNILLEKIKHKKAFLINKNLNKENEKIQFLSFFEFLWV